MQAHTYALMHPHTHGNQIYTHTHTHTDAQHEGIRSAEYLLDQANRAIGACLGQPEAYVCHRSSYD